MEDYFRNKKVLIIGGSGTIGKNLLQTILGGRPEVVRIFSRDEHKQFELQQQYSEYDNIRYLIGDVRDSSRVDRAMHGIDYVFHVAAMKHVPSCEYNPFEAVQTNVIGTQNVIQASFNNGVKRTVFTSTDKAIAPTNTYGASKLMAERLIASAQNQTGPRDTVFAAVRFGNVMGSRGSVIPLFKWQIHNKREITVTDLNMTRFMMTLKQATALTIETMKKAIGGEIFVLKMPVIKLSDLADVVIKEMSLQHQIAVNDVKIKEIGLRPGEKMFEELMTVEEASHAIELPEMFVIPNHFLGRPLFYEGGKPAEQLSYSSHNVKPIEKLVLEKMLYENDLLNRLDG
jgi:UDP-N-acetylglucosamine 4,6-dehydratase